MNEKIYHIKQQTLNFTACHVWRKNAKFETPGSDKTVASFIKVTDRLFRLTPDMKMDTRCTYLMCDFRTFRRVIRSRYCNK